MCMTQAEDEIDGSLIFSLSDHIGAGGKSAEFARARCVLKDM